MKELILLSCILTGFTACNPKEAPKSVPPAASVQSEQPKPSPTPEQKKSDHESPKKP